MKPFVTLVFIYLMSFGGVASAVQSEPRDAIASVWPYDVVRTGSELRAETDVLAKRVKRILLTSENIKENDVFSRLRRLREQIRATQPDSFRNQRPIEPGQ